MSNKEDMEREITIDSYKNEWKGFKEYIVDKIVTEAEDVKSFYITLKDKSKLPEFIPGQFIALRLKNEDETYSKIRQYTLSHKYNGQYYRVSIKREENGDFSKRICDTVKVGDVIEGTMPVGKFVLKDNDAPVVLIGAGIGITPMITMAEALVDMKKSFTLIDSVRNSKAYCFKEEIDDLNNSGFMKRVIIYTRPHEEDKEGVDYDLKGRISFEWMKDNLDVNSEFYFCGPFPFMQSIHENLLKMNVEEDKINFEFFRQGNNFK